MNLIGEYQNGNYSVKIFEDGTKIRENDLDNLTPNFPECMDVKITNCCDKNCAYCHEDSSINGLHGDILQPKFIDTLAPFTEIAIGGGNPLSHPDLKEFLNKLKSKNVIANMTVNQDHFIKEQPRIKHLVDTGLIKGLGVSFNKCTDEFLLDINQYNNAVIHVINGVVDLDELKKMYDQDLKILILGYKQFRRGNQYYSDEVVNNKTKIYENLQEIIQSFKVVSFDNLAIKQLEVKRLLSDKYWDEFYMGDDGKYTMYIDLVKQQFAQCSIADKRYDILDDIKKMFEIVKNEAQQMA